MDIDLGEGTCCTISFEVHSSVLGIAMDFAVREGAHNMEQNGSCILSILQLTGKAMVPLNNRPIVHSSAKRRIIKLYLVRSEA